MKKIFSALALVFALALAPIVKAQSYADAIASNRDLAAYAFVTYRPQISADTPVPKGYEPVYMSHYGRHGSRYHTSGYFFKAGEAGLKATKEAGILSKTGESLLTDFMAVKEAHDGMEGQLSPRGAKEHRGIASRLYERNRKLFNSNTRNFIRCISSPIQRCIISMTNFTTALNDKNPKLDFSYDTGDKYFRYICKEVTDSNLNDKYKAVADSLSDAICTYEKMFASIFTDQEKARGIIEDPKAFIRSIYMAGCICPCLDFLNVDIFGYFDEEELLNQSIALNNRFLGGHGPSKEIGKERGKYARSLARDFVVKADEALAPSSNLAADLRFGHDTGIVPLLTFLGVEGYDNEVPIATAHEQWRCYDRVCMATNFEMIFYKGRDGSFLVKMLCNEKEVTIPALASKDGPYYDWAALKEYILSL